MRSTSNASALPNQIHASTHSRIAVNRRGDFEEVETSISRLEIGQVGFDLVVRHTFVETSVPTTPRDGRRPGRPGPPPR